MRSIHERDDAYNKKLKPSSWRHAFSFAFSLRPMAMMDCNRVSLPRREVRRNAR
jgi:hypothetical protein